MDQLYPEEMAEMASRHFLNFVFPPLGGLKKFEAKGDQYDHLINGWTQYWNDVFRPKDPLESKIIKALIASESSFKTDAWNKKRGGGRARGLMQVTDETVELLSERRKELKDHFLNLSADDMLDPNLSIAAGTRWLFRKKEIAESIAKRTLTWRDAIAAYKSVKPSHVKIMKKFDEFYEELRKQP